MKNKNTEKKLLTSQKNYDKFVSRQRKTEKRKEEYSLTISEANAPLSKGIQIIIAKKGLKNLYIAKKAGFTSQELSDMLNGRRLIKACDVPKIADALGVEAGDIYEAGKEGK